MLKRNLLRTSRATTRALSTQSTFASSQRNSISILARTPASNTRSTIPAVPSSLQRIGLQHQTRWQSTEAEAKDKTAASTEGEAKPEEVSKEDATKQELEQKNKEIVDLKDKYLRSVADYRNLQERTKRDMDSARQFAIQRFATDLLDSIDNFDRALESVPKEAIKESDPSANKDLVSLYSGVKMTSEILLNVMKKHGLERFDPLEREGKKFNPQTDEATFFTKAEGKEDGEVFFTQSKGFTLNGRVVRAAKVGVVKN